MSAIKNWMGKSALWARCGALLWLALFPPLVLIGVIYEGALLAIQEVPPAFRDLLHVVKTGELP